MANSKAITIKGLFLLSALISCLTLFSRADYNLPLMVFALFNWVPSSYSGKPPVQSLILEGEVTYTPI